MSDLPDAANLVATLRFVPQACIRDYAVDVDPPGPNEWEVPVQRLRDDFASLTEFELEHERRDALRDTGPAWARDWSGPFEVELVLSKSNLESIW